jgi:hypothetical protein
MGLAQLAWPVLTKSKGGVTVFQAIVEALDNLCRCCFNPTNCIYSSRHDCFRYNLSGT